MRARRASLPQRGPIPTGGRGEERGERRPLAEPGSAARSGEWGRPRPGRGAALSGSAAASARLNGGPETVAPPLRRPAVGGRGSAAGSAPRAQTFPCARPAPPGAAVPSGRERPCRVMAGAAPRRSAHANWPRLCVRGPAGLLWAAFGAPRSRAMVLEGLFEPERF